MSTEARREQWRRSTRRRYARYVALCRDLRVPVRSCTWAAHFAELRREGLVPSQRERWWVERVGADRASELGGGLS